MLENSLLNSLENLSAHRKIFNQEEGLESFCNVFGFQLARHHKVMADKFERALKEPNYNIGIAIPVGHAKSTYASYLFPSYCLGRFPKKSLGMATHTASFSAHWGRTVRRLITSDKYKQIMRAELTKDSKAADRFDLTNGSQYFACGVGGAMTGRRLDIALIDDPMRGIADADSEIVRNYVWDWYLYDLSTRLKPGGNKIIVSTRWHEDDLMGRILNSPEAKYWDTLILPAIAEEEDPLGRKPGEALWPEYISEKTLIERKESLNKQDIRMWNSLYQQKPSFDEGSFFQEAWVKTSEYKPDFSDLVFFGASDYAVTADGGDYTVHLVAGYHPKSDKIYIVDMWRGQQETDVWISKFIDLCLKYKPRTWAEEGGQILKSLNPFIEREMIRRNCYTVRKQFTSTSDKTSRARSIQALMKSGDIIVMEEEWKADFIHELLKFPTGRNDDIVDAFGLLGRLLNEMIFMPKQKDKMKTDDYKSGKVLLPSLDHKLSTLNTYTDMI